MEKNERTLANPIYIHIFWPRRAACGILAPQPGIEPGPWQWKRGVLTTRLPGNSLKDIVMYSPWGGTRTLPYCCTIASWLLLLCSWLHSFPFLISNSLNLPFGTQGRSRRLKPFSCKQETGHREAFVPRKAPQGPAQFQGQPEEVLPRPRKLQVRDLQWQGSSKQPPGESIRFGHLRHSPMPG